MESIFEKGCLVQLSISAWKATRKINPEFLQGIDASREWLLATKKLIDPESLKPIAKVGNAARIYLKNISLPFPIHGMVFTPKDMISRVDSRLQDLKAEFDDAVESFVSDYAWLRQRAEEHLGQLFNELDYPLDVRQKFSFVWRFVVLDVPNGKAGVLSPEVYEREKEKFVNTMEEARQLAIESLREEFSSMVTRICERFSSSPDGKPKVFKNTTVNSFYDYFETFKQRNIFNDNSLAELVSRAQGILAGASPESIRNNEGLRDTIKENMSAVEQALADVMTMPRRRIIMD